MPQLSTEKYCSKFVAESTCKTDYHAKICIELRYEINARAGRDR